MRTKAAVSFAASITMLLLLGLPGSTLANSPWGYTILKNTCTASGGASGYGKNVLSIEMYENGTSGVGQLTARAVEQEYSSGAWHAIRDYGWSGTKFFEDNAKSHTWTYGKRYDVGAAGAGLKHRMVIKMTFGNGTAYPVANKKVIGQAC